MALSVLYRPRPKRIILKCGVERGYPGLVRKCPGVGRVRFYLKKKFFFKKRVFNLNPNLPLNNFAISAHLLPSRWCASTIRRSSSSVQGHFLISGFKWLCQLPRFGG